MSDTTVPAPRHIVLTQRRAADDLTVLEGAFPGVTFQAATGESWQDAVPQADAIFLGRGIPVDAVLDRAPKLKWIHGEGAGVDNTLTDRLRGNDVILTNSAGVHAVPIAEHVLALIFAFARQLPALGRAQTRHEWVRPEADIFELEGQTLAVIGLGHIGLTLARKAHGLGFRVLGVRRNPGSTPGFIEQIFSTADIDQAIGQADHTAICLPLTAHTRGLFDDARLSRLRAGSHIYNIGRGAIIDTAALQRALASGQVAGAGLDVTTPEPLPPDSPLWDHPRVIITNHTSGSSPKNADRTLALFHDNLARALKGQPLRNVVNKQEGY